MIVAVIAVGVGVLVGGLLLADLAPGSGGQGQVALHVAMALLAAGLVCAAAIGGSRPLTWLSLGALSVAIALGYRLFTHLGGLHPAGPPAKGPSPALLVLHGLAAATALVVVLAVAATA